MCLFSTSNKLIADKDIVCWKVIKRYNGAPFARSFMRDTIIYNDVLRGKEDYLPVPQYTLGEDAFDIKGIGYVHAFTDRRAAVYTYWLHDKSSKSIGAKVELYECVIPKGTVYYTGSDNGRECMRSAAAKRMRFVRKVRRVYKKEMNEAINYVCSYENTGM